MSVRRTRRALTRTTWGLHRLDANVRRARIGFGGRQREVACRVPGDLEHRLARSHADGADISAANTAATTDERQQPSGLGIVLRADVDAELHPLARKFVSPGTPIRRGDRVVVKTRDGEVMVKELKRRTAKTLELQSLNPAHPDRTLSPAEVEWIARIVWASQ